MIVLLACGSEPSAPEAPPPRPIAPEAVEVEAGPSPWPTDTVSLEESLERFEDLTSCVEGLRSSVPVEVAESLADLGYDAVLEDVCRGLAAAKARDPEACDALGATALRDGCRRRVALSSKDPEHCPPARAMEGRDPSCLAWTTGVTRLCDATVGEVRRTCESVSKNDPSTCGRDPACVAAVRRYGGSVAPVIEPDELVASLTIVHTAADGEEGRTTHDTLSRGVALSTEGCGSRVRIEVGGPLSEGAQLMVEVVVLPGDDGVWRADVRDLRWAPRRLAVPSVVMDASVDRITLDRRRGGLISMRLRGRLGTEATLEVTLSTFVRDLDALPAACGA